MHTDFSTDANSTPREMVEGAIAKGLKTICITDHMDKDYSEDPAEFVFDADAYFDTLKALKEEYRGKIDVRIGVELGLQPHLGAFYKELVNQYPFDFVIGSVHLVKGEDPYYKKFFDHRTDEEGYRLTFAETLNCLKATDDFDSLGHLDYVVRYGVRQAEDYSYQKYADEIDGILRRLIDSGKGLEVNTAGLKYGLGFAHPHPDVLKRYRELGGELITIGSDGHKPEHIAYDFQKALELLKACGFKYYTEFRERTPIFCQLQ